ncbi:D-psicose 3-epimerase [Bilifractor porci]|uniref:Sugar phosphate isomerase/epimerase n=1 Tax=Bilifractor porci TaxID=2606636 RepID=A0A7X2TNM1_9FIRM|nr:sugar phosphate isomerase/epimerase family protein [Bilifractor porci]MST82402.1 sugar phosphate isomerase/epimerase [Bilifractor porci]
MKHGIFYAFWEKQWAADYCYYVDKVSRLGFDVLEIGCAPLPDYTQDQVDELKKHAEDHNIILSGGYGPTPDHNIASKDPAVAAQALDWYRRLFEKMGMLDMHMLCGAIYSYWPFDFSHCDPKEEEWKRSVEAIRVLADYAKPYNIILGMETINRFESYLLNTAEESTRFVKEVGKDNVKVHLDTFHMNIEEDDIGAAIRCAGGYLGHLHTGESNRKTPGHGHLPWHEIGQALHDIHYDGMVVMEPFVSMGGQVGQDIKVWRDLCNGATEEELDEDARRACEFQRFMLDWK